MIGEENGVVTFEDIRNNAEIRTYIEKGNENLGVLGFTKHSVGHATKVSDTAAKILEELDYDARTVELARIAGYMHDIGNCVNRTDHAHSGAIMAMTILRDLGMEPKEIATVIAAIGNHDEKTGTAVDAVSAALILRALTRAQDCYALDVHQLHLDPATTKSILALGVPAGFQNAIFAIANLFIQAGVNSFDSLMVKGNSAAANADNMIYDCMAAFYMACASFMSQNYGAGKPDRVKKSYFISLGYSFGVGLALGSALFFFGRTFLALFTTESAVIDAGMKRVAVMAFAYCISAFMDCTIAASRGLGKTVVPTIIVVMGSCVFRVIWVYTIFAHFHTIPALYLLYPCSWTLTAFAEILYFVHCYKQSMALFKEPQAA